MQNATNAKAPKAQCPMPRMPNAKNAKRFRNSGAPLVLPVSTSCWPEHCNSIRAAGKGKMTPMFMWTRMHMECAPLGRRRRFGLARGRPGGSRHGRVARLRSRVLPLTCSNIVAGSLAPGENHPVRIHLIHMRVEEWHLVALHGWEYGAEHIKELRRRLPGRP